MGFGFVVSKRQLNMLDVIPVNFWWAENGILGFYTRYVDSCHFLKRWVWYYLVQCHQPKPSPTARCFSTVCLSVRMVSLPESHLDSVSSNEQPEMARHINAKKNKKREKNEMDSPLGVSVITLLSWLPRSSGPWCCSNLHGLNEPVHLDMLSPC